MATVANKVNHYIFLELVAPFNSQLTDEVNCLHIVTVHVEDWRIDGLRNV